MKNVSKTNLVSIKNTELNYNRQQKKTALSVDTPKTLSGHGNDSSKIETSSASIKKQHNSAILESSLKVSVGAGNQPLALLFKTAIEGINEVLEKNGFGSNAIQSTHDSGLDVSPKATSERILSMSLAFFSQFQKQHPVLSLEDSAKSFAETISKGIDKGFEDARNILDGLNVLDGEIASNIEKTYAYVKDGLQDFVNSYIKPEEDTDQNR